jgi:hypothetical protein
MHHFCFAPIQNADISCVNPTRHIMCCWHALFFTFDTVAWLAYGPAQGLGGSRRF